jgi:uncharacterized membrane protein
MHYFPLTWPFLLLLGVLLVVVVVLIELRVLRYAYEKIGLSRQAAYAVLILTLLGSYVNIPVARFPPERVVSEEVVDFYGVRYVVPTVEEWPGTILAVNVGGGLIPALVSVYLLIKNRLYVRGFLGVAVVTVVVYQLAQPVKGMGIAVPIFIPPLLSAAVALLLSWRQAPPLAYIAGSLGALLGADILNLDKVQGLGAPVASIGGAGTFDGVFLTGILAVLLTPLSGPARTEAEPGRRPDLGFDSREPAWQPRSG